MKKALGIVRSPSIVGLPAPAKTLLPRDLSARATLVASLLSAGCAVPAEDADVDAADLRPIAQPIENGELRPSSLNGGTALVKVRGPTGLLTSCSGQVVARDTILTAAHCLYDVGVYSGGWSKTKSVKVTITHQDPDGSWTSLSAANESVSAYVREEYVTLRSSNDKRAFGWDMAVLRRAIPYGNLVPSDVTALVTAQASDVDFAYVYGHGYFADQFCDRGCNNTLDEQLRRGFFDALTWDRNSSSQFYRTIRSDVLANDPHTCRGDSGGPWKTTGYSNPTPTSGVQFGVHVSGSGSGECAEVNARAAIVGYLDHWIRDRILEGAYASCSDTQHQVFTGSAWEWVNTRICW